MEEAKNNFDKKVKMHLACSKRNDFHKEMECIYFKDGFAYASDGIILARNRISEISGLEEHEITALDGKFLHADFYKDMLKYDNIMISEDGIECSKGNYKVFFYFSQFDKYPNAEGMFDVEDCKRVVELCKPIVKEYEALHHNFHVPNHV